MANVVQTDGLSTVWQYHMAVLQIRPFRYDDLDALIELARVSFAEEMEAQGVSQEEFLRQVRFITRGRMIPFGVLSSLAGIRWQMFVAEKSGQIVGCGAYLGNRPVKLANLMVHPDYRRRGIGEALLVRRLEALADEDVPYVTTTVLATNVASLGNLAKQSFEVFDRYTIWQSPLPYANRRRAVNHQHRSRQLRASDRALFEAVEGKLYSDLVAFGGSTVANYFPSPFTWPLEFLTGTRRWARVFEQDGRVIGFLSATTATSATAGTVSRPVIVAGVENLATFLAEPAFWLERLGKTVMQVAIPQSLKGIATALQNGGWTEGRTWVQLARKLNKDPAQRP